MSSEKASLTKQTYVGNHNFTTEVDGRETPLSFTTPYTLEIDNLNNRILTWGKIKVTHDPIVITKTKVPDASTTAAPSTTPVPAVVLHPTEKVITVTDNNNNNNNK
jgi:hypothetical protein